MEQLNNSSILYGHKFTEYFRSIGNELKILKSAARCCYFVRDVPWSFGKMEAIHHAFD